MLPPDAVEKIKFLKKNNNKEYVAEDQRLVAWGGEDFKTIFLTKPRNAATEMNGSVQQFAIRYSISLLGETLHAAN